MINREDMLALTRRMTVKRTSITRIAGGYMDIDGFIDGTFNTSFLKLSPSEQEKNLALAKKVPFAKTNKNLKEYKFSDDQRNPDSMWKLLMGMRACGLKNDALMETFYEIIGEHYQADEDYAIYVFHDRYDIPAKGLDHIRQGESERMYEYILCVTRMKNCLNCLEWKGKSYGRNIQVRRKSKIPVGRGNERMHEKSSGREDHCERDHRRMRSDASDLLPEFSG